MAWTWETHPAEGAWGHDKEARREHRDPLARFLMHVDGMLYVAAGALVVCLVALLFG